MRPARFRIVFLLCFFISSIACLRGQNLDVNILKNINPRYPTSQFWIQTSASVYWVSGIAGIGSLTYGLLSKNKEDLHNGCQTLMALGADIIVSEALKSAFHRTRPGDRYPDEIFPRSPTHGKSFPSEHTSLAFATATSLAFEYRKWYVAVPAFLWAGSMGYSRMYLGKHYPSDVLAGAVVGMGSGYLSYWLTKKLFHSK